MPTLWLHCLLAHSFLCIMGSSAPVERSFNKCGQALRDSRNRLDPEVVSDLVFCAENLAFVRGTGEWSTTCASIVVLVLLVTVVVIAIIIVAVVVIAIIIVAVVVITIIIVAVVVVVE